MTVLSLPHILWSRRVGIPGPGTTDRPKICSQATPLLRDYGGGMLRSSAFASVIVELLLLTGCSFAPPIVPPDISAMVNGQGRERTYDLVWQDIRRFEGALQRGESANFDEQALVILARINRLAQGKASGMTESQYRVILEDTQRTASVLTLPARRELLHQTATKTRIAFDAGRFSKAQEHALQALGYSQVHGRKITEQ